MSKNRRLPYSIPEIMAATAPRALPVYSDREMEIREALLTLGRDTALARSRGGRERAIVWKSKVRPILIENLFSSLPPVFKKTPTSTRTVGRLREQLSAQFQINISTETLIRDIKKIGTGKLRKL
jgi:hypothetical protein